MSLAAENPTPELAPVISTAPSRRTAAAAKYDDVDAATSASAAASSAAANTTRGDHVPIPIPAMLAATAPSTARRGVGTGLAKGSLDSPTPAMLDSPCPAVLPVASASAACGIRGPRSARREDKDTREEAEVKEALTSPLRIRQPCVSLLAPQAACRRRGWQWVAALAPVAAAHGIVVNMSACYESCGWRRRAGHAEVLWLKRVT
mmetsp:Transcript_37120/g.59657  ORF Transcript_37120/g.59657 Transcript_37120/m.59657 type:complete len:205 (-) Transcript_37120:19-633(-)